MVNLTLSIPEELKEEMQQIGIMNWSAVAREAFEQKIADFKFLRDFKKKSEITKEDAINLGREVNNKLSKKYLEK